MSILQACKIWIETRTDALIFFSPGTCTQEIAQAKAQFRIVELMALDEKERAQIANQMAKICQNLGKSFDAYLPNDRLQTLFLQCKIENLMCSSAIKALYVYSMHRSPLLDDTEKAVRKSFEQIKKIDRLVQENKCLFACELHEIFKTLLKVRTNIVALPNDMRGTLGYRRWQDIAPQAMSAVSFDQFERIDQIYSYIQQRMLDNKPAV